MHRGGTGDLRHRDLNGTIRSPGFTSIGIGLAISPDGAQIYATQNFGG